MRLARRLAAGMMAGDARCPRWYASRAAGTTTKRREPHMELSIDRTSAGRTCTLVLAGEVDVYTAPALRQQLLDSIDEGCMDVIIDLENVGFIDSSGLGVLVGVLKRIRENDGSLRLAAANESIVKVLMITGLDKVFPLYRDVAEAESERDNGRGSGA